MIDYEGRRFRPEHGGPDASTALYRQDGDLVWAEFQGGEVRRGSLTGRCAEDGTLEFAYTMVLAGGEVISGHNVSVPELLPDGRVRLHERWERFGAHADAGLSTIVEVKA